MATHSTASATAIKTWRLTYDRTVEPCPRTALPKTFPIANCPQGELGPSDMRCTHQFSRATIRVQACNSIGNHIHRNVLQQAKGRIYTIIHPSVVRRGQINNQPPLPRRAPGNQTNRTSESTEMRVDPRDPLHDPGGTPRSDSHRHTRQH